MFVGGIYMAKREGLTRDQMLKKALEKFDLNAFKAWIKRFEKGLWNSFQKSNEEVQIGTMCKCICNRTDMLATKACKKARKWLAEHNMKGKIY